MKHANPKARSWIFTLNNYSEADWKYVEEGMDGKVKYLVCGREGDEPGKTPHLQGYVTWVNPRSFNNMRTAFFGGKASWRIAKADALKNWQYCSKEGRSVEIGSRPTPGKRTDLAHVRDMLAGGSGVRGVIEADATCAALRYAESVVKYVESERDWKPTVFWLWGDTGAGKTRAAREAYPNAWTTGANKRWWDGYDAHSEVIIDDIRADSYTFVNLLSILDRYAFRVEVKGGTRQLLARVIVITCPQTPTDLFANSGHIVGEFEQLERRIDWVWEVKK